MSLQCSVTKSARAMQLFKVRGQSILQRAFSSRGQDEKGVDPFSKLQAGSLVLEDGTILPGFHFGDTRSISGEVVFNTGMVGYPESLTDPSYRGQIMVCTYPLIGNYGVPVDSLDNYDLRENFESDRIQVRGLIVSDYSQQYSHWNAARSLSSWLKVHNIPALTGVDTRLLTKRIRDKGAMLGKILAEKDVAFEDPNKQNLVAQVSCTGLKIYGQGRGDVHILAVDCGMKQSIIRQLVNRGAVVTVVPWDHDVAKEMESGQYDGLFISNGPGDPAQCTPTIQQLQSIMSSGTNKPIFGICLGHQLLALAAGCRTYKLPYGHRGHNQPCIDLSDNRCYLTSQNHGFAVDTQNLRSDWRPYFVNANDGTSEGIIHSSKPWFSVQFHPEAHGGPNDTLFLFDRFLGVVRKTKERPQTSVAARSGLSIGQMLTSGKSVQECMGTFDVAPLSTISPRAAKRVAERPPSKVLILGSGGLQIGQAGEFDYSGSQAIKALKEEGIQTILINPNIATVQTAKGLADKVYFLPVTPEFVQSIIEKERPDGILLQFGGQTALNCGVELYKRGILAQNNVQVLGTSVETIIATEDRDEFAIKLTEIGEPIAKSVAATTVDDAVFAAEQIGYPVIIRAAFSLGGLGSGFANNRAELVDLVKKALAATPQVLVERSMKGWKELEYEVVRDANNNCVTVCNMENFDPLGIHTGDSIVVAPSQTLDDYEYHMLRTSAIRIVRHLGIVGECNVQYALNPKSRQYCVIEVNPRLSRSSALASKATGYPLAFVAAKLALGKSLPDLQNSMTKATGACFEPSLDYIVTKIPRWDFKKFANTNNELGSAMKSVGEVMAIGRTFEESFQKALRMVDSSVQGFQPKHFADLEKELTRPTDQRVFALAQAFEQGYSVDELHDLTKIDKWFLHKLGRIQNMKGSLRALEGSPDDVVASSAFVNLLKHAKRMGFSDRQVVDHLPATAPLTVDQIRQARVSQGIVPYAKQIDTLAAEFPAKTNYLYMTYSGSEHDVTFDGKPSIGVLGGGCYCIGNSVEFDYSAVSAIRTLRELGHRTLMVNYNPETVSTDYDESDRLYFEELSLERVLDVFDVERPQGTILSVGGQIPNNLAVPLHKAGVRIFGTSADMIDQAEDRNKFSSLLDSIGVQQPRWKALTDMQSAYDFAAEVGYPVLVRPSYVLSGAAMRVVRSSKALESLLRNAAAVSKEHPVVISKLWQGAMEIELDGVADKGDIKVHAISEHIEEAGVHSGDASLVLPCQVLPKTMQDRIYEIGAKISKALHISGPVNIQFLVKGDDIAVIECNIRASRSFPFVSKILGVDFIKLATKIMTGASYDPATLALDYTKLNFVGVKVPNFSFQRLRGADPILGVEMASTGEVACFGESKDEAFLKAMLAANFKLPRKSVLLMTGVQKDVFLPSAKQLVEMGFTVYATPGTSAHLFANGVPNTLTVIGDGSEPNDVQRLLQERAIDLVINFPQAEHQSIANLSALGEKEAQAAHAKYQSVYRVRRAAVDYSIPVIVNAQVAEELVRALASTSTFSLRGSHELSHAAVSADV